MTSRGNNFNYFHENQLTIDSAILCKPTWGNTTISRSPLYWDYLGERRPPKKYSGERRYSAFPPRVPRDYTTDKEPPILDAHYMVTHKNVPISVFDCNSDVSWANFTIFAPVDTGMNRLFSLQSTYLTAWWRHMARHEILLRASCVNSQN